MTEEPQTITSGNEYLQSILDSGLVSFRHCVRTDTEVHRRACRYIASVPGYCPGEEDAHARTAFAPLTVASLFDVLEPFVILKYSQ